MHDMSMEKQVLQIIVLMTNYSLLETSNFIPICNRDSVIVSQPCKHMQAALNEDYAQQWKSNFLRVYKN